MTQRAVVRLASMLGLFCFVLVLTGCSRPTHPLSSSGFTDFGGVWGTSAADVYVVGSRYDQGGWQSLILHYDGRQWTPSLPKATARLASMWGNSSDQFIVGFIPFEDGRILHRGSNGSGWNTGPSGAGVELHGVWGSSASDVFAVGSRRVGDGGAIIHYDGNSWSTQVDTAAVWGVWGSSGSDVYAVGPSILHYDGSSWSAQVANPRAYHFGVWGSSRSDVFAVGGSGTIRHNDGNSWSSQVSGTTAILLGVWGTSPSDVFVVGQEGTILHYDGSSWTSQTSGTKADLLGVWGSSGADVFAVGYEGTLLHYDGTNWSAVKWQPTSRW